MKKIETIVKLIERAERKGVASQKRRYVEGYDAGGLVEVYRVECEPRGKGIGFDLYKLYHYGTLTANVVVNNDGTPVARYVYGESRSDADSVNTFLSHFGLPANWTFRPVNGGFQEVE